MRTAQTTSADIVPERLGARGRAWWQFSLFSLLLLLLAGCAVAAWIGEIRRRKAAERATANVKAEMRELRTAVGLTDDRPDVLQITDEKQVYVRAFPPVDDLTWQWRIHTPPGRKRWMIRISHGDTWDENQGSYAGGGGSSINVDGEFTLEARVVRNLSDGRPFITVGTLRSSSSTVIPEEGLATLASDGKLTAEYSGIKQQEVFAPDQRVPLLRWHRQLGTGSTLGRRRRRSVPGTAPPSFPEYGLTIDLEPWMPTGTGKVGGALPAAKAGNGGPR